MESKARSASSLSPGETLFAKAHHRPNLVGRSSHLLSTSADHQPRRRLAAGRRPEEGAAKGPLGHLLLLLLLLPRRHGRRLGQAGQSALGSANELVATLLFADAIRVEAEATCCTWLELFGGGCGKGCGGDEVGRLAA